MTTHALKSWPVFFEAVVTGIKKHEIRRNDRDYKVGDTLRLMEFDPETQNYTGKEFSVVITYITSDSKPCALSGAYLSSDYCAMSIEPTDAGREQILEALTSLTRMIRNASDIYGAKQLEWLLQKPSFKNAELAIRECNGKGVRP